ncbi:MAG TPA: Sir2 family NAD-dependent protein deacetylase [Pseudomonadales bacterium]|nr:Sir2 family NAD-dependent protein deacetylase [Pseudomonadales bacterium]
MVDDELTRFARMLDAARSAVVFTGAGISTESGIPDFRSPGGLWTRMKPIQFQDFVASEAVRQESWRRRFSGERTLETAQPNRGHEAVARLVARGSVAAVITQNIDNLHQASGIDDERIIELHGNAHHATCLDCRRRYELADLEATFARDGAVPPCADCGGIIKTATISFGQSMPEREMMRAEAATLAADLFVVVGSSLVVHPAAGFPELAARRGVPLVILNREPTPLDDLATLVLHREIGETLAFALDMN